MDGLINVLKPPGMTSFDVVAYLRKILREKKIGHAGTLDPAAAGVLLVCTGKATRVVEYITRMKKTYRAELTLGISTDTQDSSGNIIARKEVNLSREKIVEAVESFTGEIYQAPPMYSAVKVGGKRLYELARKGEIIERRPRKIVIHSISIVNIEDARVLFDVTCSKGTYVRTLCSDIGDKLGCGAHMSFLVRKRIGVFGIESAFTLEDILKTSEAGQLTRILLNIDTAFSDFKSYHLNCPDDWRFKNGGFIPVNAGSVKDRDFYEGMEVRVYDRANEFIGIGEIVKKQGRFYLKPGKILA
ncbi:MAG: tRNA pseudouridine(55) synthase TruB [Clostridiaceae bacterium]|nr:tRNA pseudouridine(55) synthase TruB [Clostridiaceae bacterium]